MSRAVIIPFPGREPGSEGQGKDRLRAALDQLQTALAAQQQAVQGWRTSIGELNLGVATLSHSLVRYQDSLDRLQGAATGLNAQSRTLEVWADAVTPSIR